MSETHFDPTMLQGGLANQQVSPNWHDPISVGFKRSLDVLISSLLLLLLSPLLLILGFVVMLTSKGPIFYRWKVVGRAGQPFTSFKFRSMVVNADQLKAQLECLNEMHGPVFKITNDPRITRVGWWMRRYSLDELPQLYSVLVGDMSLVGPRPPLVTEYARFSDYQKKKLSVKPGITCLWQISGRNSVRDFDDWVRLDLEYISRWSPKLDLWILWKTVAEVAGGSGK